MSTSQSEADELTSKPEDKPSDADPPGRRRFLLFDRGTEFLFLTAVAALMQLCCSSLRSIPALCSIAWGFVAGIFFICFLEVIKFYPLRSRKLLLPAIVSALLFLAFDGALIWSVILALTEKVPAPWLYILEIAPFVLYIGARAYLWFYRRHLDHRYHYLKGRWIKFQRISTY